MLIDPRSLTDEELERRHRAIRELFEEQKTNLEKFDAQFWSEIRGRMNSPVSSKVYLFAECLRIVSQIDPDKLHEPEREHPLASPRSRLRHYDALVREAQILFQKSFLSTALCENGLDQVRAALRTDDVYTLKDIEELGREIARRATVAEEEAKAEQNRPRR